MYYIRPVKPSDAPALSELRRMPGVFENILGIPSERQKRTEDFIAGLDASSHSFVAVHKNDSGEEVAVGIAGLKIETSPRLRHSASIGIYIHKDHQNKHLGTKLMEALIDMADNWLMLVRLELTVFTDNSKAINLYTKFGFETEGRKKMAAIRNGEYADEYLMARLRPNM